MKYDFLFEVYKITWKYIYFKNKHTSFKLLRHKSYDFKLNDYYSAYQIKTNTIRGNKIPIFIDYCVFFVQLILNYWFLPDIKEIIKKNKDVI